MKYYAVIDTNVLVSAMLKSASVPGQIVNKALMGDIIPLLSDEIIAEYRDVLHRQKFKFNPKVVKVFIEGIIDRGIFVDVGSVDEIFPDPKDIVFYEVAMEGRKENDETYLVTGNLKHFPVKSFIVTPKEMLEIVTGMKYSGEQGVYFKQR